MKLSELKTKDGKPGLPEEKEELIYQGGGNPIEYAEYNESLRIVGSLNLRVDIKHLSYLVGDYAAVKVSQTLSEFLYVEDDK